MSDLVDVARTAKKSTNPVVRWLATELLLAREKLGGPAQTEVSFDALREKVRCDWIKTGNARLRILLDDMNNPRDGLPEHISTYQERYERIAGK